MKVVSRALVPRVADIGVGPPVARIMPFSAAVMSIGLCLAAFLRIPVASVATLPFFALPIPLLASTKTYRVVLAYCLLALGCAAKAVAGVFAPNLYAGQVASGFVVWGWMAWNFALSAAMIQVRGIRQPDKAGP